jgi:hypothetical protein
LPFWPALEGSQVDHSVAPAAYFIARINHESNSFLLHGRASYLRGLQLN